MMKNEDDIAIIGAGLAGLTIAYYLEKAGISYQIIEARARIGGRILTISDSNGSTLEMGATWFGSQHKNLISLTKELALPFEEQYVGSRALYEYGHPNRTTQVVDLPGNMQPTYRFSKGTSSLTDALLRIVDAKKLHLSESLESLTIAEDYVTVKTDRRQFNSLVVINTLPPNLFMNSIRVFPRLPENLISIGRQTHTWMGESIKVALEYDRPFWRDRSIGSLFSQFGPVQEMHDHINHGSESFSLKGFVDPSFHDADKNTREMEVRNQLTNYFGEDEANLLAYHEMDWQNEMFTFFPYQPNVFPHQNNGHSIFRYPYFEGKLFFGGSEASANFPGYMEGAVERGKEIAEEIIQSKNSKP